MGLIFKSLGNIEQALVSYERAIEMQPDYVEAHWNKSLALLLGGQLREGFELFEWRWKLQKTELKPREFKVPLWLGEQDLAGQTIMIHHEQGLGDGIQFCRYVPLLKELGARVLLVVPKPLVTLMLSLQGVDEVIESGQALPEFDFHCPMLSLPLAFKTDLSTIPLAQGYLSADPLKSEAWRKKLGEKRRLRVGVVWNGGAKAKESEFWSANGRRNIELSEFAQALSGLDVDFYSLQKGDPAESEIRGREAEYWPEGNFFNHVGDLKDFSDTAALVEQLDLVISVDTSTAHLAAAMGKPTWILNRFDTCWRWLLQRNDSPWYQSVTLYRQDISRLWNPVLKQLGNDLSSVKAREFQSLNEKSETLVNDSQTHLFHIGNHLLKHEKIHDAFKYFEVIVSADPRHDKALHRLGLISHLLGDHKLAVELLLQSIEVNPRCAEVFYDCGIVLQAMGMHDQARISYEQAILIKSDFVEAFYNLGNVQTELGQLNLALTNFEKLVAKDDQHYKAWFSHGNVLKSLSRYEEAVLSYQKALKIRSDFAPALNELGNVFKELNVLDEAISCYEKALEVDSNLADAGKNLENIRSEF
jgi:tetratricopeptide (TPR) repeat protein